MSAVVRLGVGVIVITHHVDMNPLAPHCLARVWRHGMIDPTALAMYMRLNFVPGATSIFPGVKKVPPAHYVSIALDKPVEPVATRYWQIDWEVECEEHSESSWLERIDELLHDAVRIRLRSIRRTARNVSIRGNRLWPGDGRGCPNIGFGTAGFYRRLSRD